LEQFYTCEQIASRYGMNVHTIRLWIKEKKLPALRIGRYYRVRHSDLLAFEKQNSTIEK